MKKAVVIINKNWETEPVLNSLTNATIRPARLPFPRIINTPKDGNNKMDVPRAIFSFSDGIDTTLEVSVWCIQDLMYLGVAPEQKAQSSSSSEEKYHVLQPIIKSENPDIVIAVGTAGYPSATSFNGSVVIGANFFVHNGHPENPKSNLTHPDIGKVLISNVNDVLFDIFNSDFKNQTEPKFINPPRNSSKNPVCIAAKVFTALSSINVTDYREYNWVDHEAIVHYKQVEKQLPINSLETTHGVIKFSTDKPIIFISAITDRLEHFDTEVTATQTYVSSFNAGIVLGQLFCSLNDFVMQRNRLEK